MRIGLVCPYSLDMPGGVQSHVRGLAEALRRRGHFVRVLAPGVAVGASGSDADVWSDAASALVSVDAASTSAASPSITYAGRAVPVAYNGSVARLAFGPRVALRTRRWLTDGDFDLLHVHEPTTPSVSLLALRASTAPVVATFHTSTDRSRMLESVESMLRPSSPGWPPGSLSRNQRARRWCTMWEATRSSYPMGSMSERSRAPSRVESGLSLDLPWCS
ncbi:MAG: glycosyltransferase family 4 protein [Nocardioidaceae bacterium]